MKKSLIIATLVLIILSSCKKSKDNPDQLSLLTSVTWRPSKTDKNNSTSPTLTSLYYPPENCEMDDTWSFSNKLFIDRGDNKCNANEVRTETFDFNIDLNNKKITIKGMHYELAELSATQLKYYAPIPSATGYYYVIYLFEPVK